MRPRGEESRGVRGRQARRSDRGLRLREKGSSLRAGVVLSAVLAVLPGVVRGQTVSIGAEVEASTRVFADTPLFADQGSSRVSPSVAVAPDFVLESADGAWRLVGEGFARLDADDASRSHLDVRELGIRYMGTRVTAFVGAGQVFWGVTEIRHLVDVVNQVDGVEDLDGEDKLGQPMVSVTVEGGWGALDLYYLPYFRQRSFPAEDARLRGPVPVAKQGVYATSRGRWHPGFAARAFRTFGAVDIGVSAFRGTSREPVLEAGTDAEGVPVLHPAYGLVDQIGVDAQWTGERTLLKLEAITRGGYGSRLYAFAAGVEHTLYQIGGGDGDLGLLGEIMLDSRGDAAPPTLFQRDVFVGGRWAWNDIADTSVLGGPLLDLDSGEALLLLEAERRIAGSWRVAAEARLLANTHRGSPAHQIRNDGFVSISLTRYF